MPKNKNDTMSNNITTAVIIICFGIYTLYHVDITESHIIAHIESHRIAQNNITIITATAAVTTTKAISLTL